MGMFDSVYVKCTGCGYNVEFQSKAGNCALQEFSLEDAPADIQRSLIGRLEKCDHCGAVISIHYDGEANKILIFDGTTAKDEYAYVSLYNKYGKPLVVTDLRGVI